MPAVFSEQARAEIRRRLQQEAVAQLAEKPYSKIKIEDLAKAAGISKGAFYKFYPAKELFFYELLRQLHEQLYSPVLEKFTKGTGDPAADFCGCLLESCRLLQSSGLQRFWLEDSRQILAALPEGRREAQRQGRSLFSGAFWHGMALWLSARRRPWTPCGRSFSRFTTAGSWAITMKAF